MQVGIVFGIDAACAHEVKSALDFIGEVFVALTFRGRTNELLGPCVNAVEVGKTTFGECTQQVERACRLVVRLYQAFRVWLTRCFSGGFIVHNVATERRQHEVAYFFKWL